jgi:hypothetical protein
MDFILQSFKGVKLVSDHSQRGYRSTLYKAWPEAVTRYINLTLPDAPKGGCYLSLQYHTDLITAACRVIKRDSHCLYVR